MRIHFSSFLASTVLIVSSFSAAFAEDYTGFYISSNSKKITLTKTGASLELTTAAVNTSLYQYFQGTKKIEVDVEADFAGSHKLNLQNGVEATFTLADATKPKKVTITSTQTEAPDLFHKNKNPTTFALSAVPTYSANKLTLAYKDSSNADKTLEITLAGVSDLLSLKAFQGSAPPSTHADGSFVFTNKFGNHKFYVSKTATHTVLLMFNEEPGFFTNLFEMTYRPAIFAMLTATFSGVMTLTVKSLDPEMYVLGGGFYGALLGQDASDADSQEMLSLNDDDGDNGFSDPSSPNQGPRSRNGRSPSGLSKNAQDANNASVNADGSEEVSQKTDARTASLVAVLAAAIALLI